jgi:predicted mannosyl-3-phosphoglycerate phosphatase (HAD superfamily)
VNARRLIERPRVIFVDVDGTLSLRGNPNAPLVKFLRRRKSEGFEIVLWSMRGARYAHEAAKAFGVLDLFDAIVSKPGFVVDDKGLEWLRSAMILTPDNLTEEPE